MLNIKGAGSSSIENKWNEISSLIMEEKKQETLHYGDIG